jgi:hypothetical protein
MFAPSCIPPKKTPETEEAPLTWPLAHVRVISQHRKETAMKKRKWTYLGTSLALVLCSVSCGELESPTNPAMVPFSNSAADGGSVAPASSTGGP